MDEQLEEIVCVPTSCFSSGFDASFAFVGANEAKREAAHDGHILGVVDSTRQLGTRTSPCSALNARPLTAAGAGEVRALPPG
jgi:hypothetical protein